jgi:hypothetical protein
VGIKYHVLGLDFAYLVPVNAIKNPLNNTLRFTLIFNFGALKKTQKKPNNNTETPSNNQ